MLLFATLASLTAIAFIGLALVGLGVSTAANTKPCATVVGAANDTRETVADTTDQVLRRYAQRAANK